MCIMYIVYIVYVHCFNWSLTQIFTEHFQDHISVFVLNGYEELESFAELDESELDYLGIHEIRKRSIIMAAVEWLQDTMSG